MYMAIVLWQGPSAFDGAEIVVLGVTTSRNAKTGPMAQTYIVRPDLHPVEAKQQGLDVSICGDCKLREGMCYVSLHRGVGAVWKGSRKVMRPAKFGWGLRIRIGAYGDGAAAPYELWEEMLQGATGHTGYTHAWRYCDQRYKNILMASCDTPQEAQEAQALGWKTYRVRLPEETRMPGERPCPYNGGQNGVMCYTCLGCNGQRRSFVVEAHGNPAQVRRYREFRLTHTA
jgi:hypothetical protein